MCGIVAAVGQRDVPEILLEGLRRLEYRGYDSAGLAVIDGAGKLKVCNNRGNTWLIFEHGQHPIGITADGTNSMS